MSELQEEECICDDPQKPGNKLMLCGKAICVRLLNNGRPIKPVLIASDEDDSES